MSPTDNLVAVRQAAQTLSNVAHQTPVLTSSTLDRMTGLRLHFKCENFQRVGAFKFRGAYYAISQLPKPQKEAGVVTHSSGNHAQALALAGQLLGVNTTVVMPENSPAVKVEATKGYGAEVVFCPPTLEGRRAVAQQLVDLHGYTLVHPFNNPHVIHGQGTVGLELIGQVPNLDNVVTPVGGGGLLSGVSSVVKELVGGVTVYGAEPRNADDAYRSFHAGRVIPQTNPTTVADGLRTSLSDLTFSFIQANVDDILLVTEQGILRAMRLLWERMKLVVEPSGAVPLAAVLENSDRFSPGSQVVMVLSGGNVDLNDFFRHLEGRLDLQR